MSMGSSKAKSGSGVPFEAIYPGVSQKRTSTATSAQSSAFGDKTSVVMLYCTEDTHVKFGTNPTAVADGTCLFVPADTFMMVGVKAGHKLAAIRDSADGILYITEGA